MTVPGHGYADAVTGWMHALRDGDTRTWTQWLDGASTRSAAQRSDGGPLPGAGQLELVRRIAVADPQLPDFASLAGIVLGTSPVGRGPVDIPLPWEDRSGAAYGSPPTDPETLPPQELLRVALGTLVRLLREAPVAASVRTAATPPRRSRSLWRRARFRVYGAPGSADAARRALLEGGLVRGDFRAVHLVVVGPLEQVVQQHWTARSHAGGSRPWRRTWRSMAARDRLPPRLDPVALANRIAATTRSDRVHLLIAATPDDAVRLTAELCGIESPRPTSPAEPPALVDLRRRINPMLDQQLPTADVVAVRDRLDRWLDDPPAEAGHLGRGSVRALAVPPGLRAWAATAAERVAELVGSAGYPVHGDLAELARLLPPGTPSEVSEDDTLAVAVAAIRAGWWTTKRAATRTEVT